MLVSLITEGLNHLTPIHEKNWLVVYRHVEIHSGARENIIAGPYPPFCMSWDRTWEECPLAIRLGVRGSVVRSPAGSRAEPRLKMILCKFYVRKKPSGPPFSVFLSDTGPPKRRGARENSPIPPLDGPGCILRQKLTWQNSCGAT